jgi:hypothetical protein
MPWGCGGRNSGAFRRRVHETTPLTITALPTDTVTVTDPTHPLSGRTFPLVGVTTKQRLGRVCVVWLHPGVERVIPVAATTLAPAPPPPPPCKLSVAGLHTLLAVLGFRADLRQEDPYDTATPASESGQPPTAVPLGGHPTTPPSSAARRPAPPPCTPVDEPLPVPAHPRTPHALPYSRGGAQ